jgi:hypothetical protein
MRFFSLSLMVVCAAMVGCRAPCKNNLPPAQALMHPGPGVDGPGPGVMGYPPSMPSPNLTSQISFVGPEGTSVSWDVSAPGAFDSEPLTCPGRCCFPQNNIYRLKLSKIPGRPGVELYPTLEVAPVMPRTEAYLAHSAIPVQFSPEDFDQVLSGNFVTKVIYLPDPEFQELALAGVDTLVSTRLDPGVDPVIEADRRGAILAIVRLGNKDLQVPGSHGVEGGVGAAGYQSPNGCPQPPMPGAMMPGAAGTGAPQYGMPMSGTPIGLVGPPSVPMGVPAGLQKHTIVNHTHVCLPKPTDSVRIDVKQKPGMSYPQPAHHARIVERTASGVGTYRQPLGDRRECVKSECPTQECPTDGATSDSGEAQEPCQK